MDMDGLMMVLCGVYSLGMAVFHLFFPKLFNWKDDLQSIKPFNRGILYILNWRLTFLFLLIGAVCLLFPTELTTTPLGRFLMIGFSLFWLGRFIEQFIYLKVEHPLVHLLTYLFLAGAILYAVPVIL